MAEQHESNGSGVGLAIGSKVGKYEIRERRAIGGQSVVYKAHDALLDRHVAIKQISTHLAEDPKFLERFRKEAQILARLGGEQPAIVNIHEMIEEERGLFIVMEWVQGHTLETILNDTEGPVETKAALQVLWRLAAALHDVHAAGIVHRDIKPGNILIAEGLRPKITDFGVAASASGQTSMVLGTTKYMAPELFEGGKSDARVDMYSLGMVAYEMLAGRPKFQEVFADIVRDKHSEAMRWMKWHGNRELKAPPLREVNPVISGALSDIVERMMAKDPDERFATMEELGRAIKTTFSPKARAVAAAAAAGARRGRPAPGKASRAAFADRKDIGPGDGADELEVDAHPTAAIPKTGVSTRTKVLVAAVVFVGLLSVGIGWVYKQSLADREKREAASLALAEAMMPYESGRYADAATALAAVRTKHAGTSEGNKARVLEHLATARLHLADSEQQADWQNLTAQALADAAKAIKAVQASSASPDAKWIENREREILELNDSLTATRIFLSALADARTHLEQRKFDTAEQFLTQGTITGVPLTRTQRQRIEDYRKEIRLAEFRIRHAEYLDSGQQHLEQAIATRNPESFDTAKQAFEGAQQWLDAKGEILPADERDRLRAGLADSMTRLQRERDYRDTLAAAEGARDAGDMDRERAALERAVAMKPNPAMAQRITAILAETAYRKGAAALEAGNFAEARPFLQEALRHDPQHTPATAALEQIDRGGRKQDLLAAGDRAFATGDLPGALKSYLLAAEVEPDAALTDKIRETRYQIALQDANALRKDKKYPDAQAAYVRASEIAPEHAEEIAGLLAAMKQEQTYDELIAKGDDAARLQQWEKALGFYNEAKKLFETPLVNDRITLTQYREYVWKGDKAMGQNDYAGALGYYRLAQGKLDTDEVKQKIAEAEKKQKG